MTGVYEDFPVGLALGGGRWRVAELLRGSADWGQLRAAGTPTGLVTIVPPLRGDREAVVTRLALASPGIAPMLWAERVEHGGASYDVLVEAEPDGASVDTWQGSAETARRIARQLATIVREAHARGLVLGGLRPELAYVAGETVTGVAPRAEPLFANATERCYGVPPCFEQFYLSPEQLALRPPGPPSDVFSLGATLARLLTGQPPFAGATTMERLGAALRANHGALEAAGELAPLLSRMMAADPTARPAMDAVCAALS